MTTRVTILGCGSSGGVPRIGNDWGKCNPDNPKNARFRCSILITKTGENGGKTNVLIDTSPDLRQQLNAANTAHVDAVLYTHPHADHIHGIDDLRPMTIVDRHRVAVYADSQTASKLLSRFDYCFKTPPNSDYPPILDLYPLQAGKDITITGAGGDIVATPFLVHHGRIDALGFRINNIAYTPDLNGIPSDSIKYVQGLDCWVVDSLRRTPHPSHFSLPETLEWIDKTQPKRALLTNLHTDMDYETTRLNTPDMVDVCYDGLSFTI